MHDELNSGATKYVHAVYACIWEEVWEQLNLLLYSNFIFPIPTHVWSCPTLRNDEMTTCRAEPPRPSPGAVLYSDEAPPQYEDSSSVDEKAELSSDDDDDDDTKVRRLPSASEPGSVYSTTLMTRFLVFSKN